MPFYSSRSRVEASRFKAQGILKPQGNACPHIHTSTPSFFIFIRVTYFQTAREYRVALGQKRSEKVERPALSKYLVCRPSLATDRDSRTATGILREYRLALLSERVVKGVPMVRAQRRTSGLHTHPAAVKRVIAQRLGRRKYFQAGGTDPSGESW